MVFGLPLTTYAFGHPHRARLSAVEILSEQVYRDFRIVAEPSEHSAPLTTHRRSALRSGAAPYSATTPTRQRRSRVVSGSR